ncbi:response regulator [Actinoplanes utahensis]|uniref:LuxR family transcriptional regulator n=1 Tax=Actinoplanes utahensis TaxID=1869 RepID=A0A0A6URA2_ACTUT|nr:response regulator transcription factor [Actinoplanes utahensis]KHD77961.1 LuxR family transcriptional regulator [Actinoplanes utahensis]GIF29929.1 DNA-binding response regulator [Actinoplanes utahensis]
MRVLIAEDQALLRDGLTRMLTAYGFDVVATAADGTGLTERLVEVRPDIAVVDVRLPPTFTDEGLRAALTAREQVPGLPILVLSQYVERLYARELLADRAGAVGYLLKDRVGDVRQFVAALHQVAAGGTVIDPDVIARLLHGRDSLTDLTHREQDVLRLMAEGHSNAAVATHLTITEKSVSNLINALFAKLGLPPSTSHHRRVLAVLAYLDDRDR